MELQIASLPNGVRLVHYQVPGAVAHCGVFIRAGTRDEGPGEHGIAHFIEHTIFKGTQKRNLFQVLNRLENVGADLNAYTTKEETVIHASFLKEHYHRTLELFSDILLHSVFPEKEIEREKQVVEEEIRSYKDNPAEQIFDDFEDQVFAGHPLGKNILGTMASLKKISREQILTFIRKNYQPEAIVIVSVGDIRFKMLSGWIGKFFGDLRGSEDKPQRALFSGYEPQVRVKRKKLFQVHSLAGTPAYSFADNRRVTLSLLNNLLGGPVMNSRLSLALRERNGLTYHNESNYTAYSDTGIFSIYFGTDPAHFEKATMIIRKELDKLKTTRLSPLMLHTVKQQFKGQILIASESNPAMMMAIGKSFLLLGCFEPVESLIRKIDNISGENILEVANEIFDYPRMSSLVFTGHPGAR